MTWSELCAKILQSYDIKIRRAQSTYLYTHKKCSFRYILRWEWLFGELEKEKKRKWMTNKSWQRQHCLRIVRCLKTPIQNSCVRLFYPLSFKISKIPSQNVFCVFVTLRPSYSCIVDMSVIQIIQLAVGTNL